VAGTNTVKITVTAADNASKALAGIKKNAAALGAVVAGAAAAFASFKILQDVIGTTTALGGEVNKMRRETGMAAEDASRLIFAFKHVGMTGDDASRSIGIFAKKLKGIEDTETGVASGGKTMAAILADIGISATDATGNLKPMMELLVPLADRFKAMPNGLEKTGLAMQLFGRSGKSMIPLLNLGSEGLKDLSAQADKLGVTLSGENADAIKKFTYAQRDMKQAVVGLKLAVGVQLMPVLADIMKWLTDNQPRIQGFAKQLGENLVNAIQKVKDVAKGIGDFLKPILGGLTAGDIGTISAALSIGLAGAFATVAVAAMAAYVAENLALFGIPALVTAAVVAIVLLQRHWTEVWGALQAAPASLLKWLQDHWRDVLLFMTGPAGGLIFLVKNWGAVWDALPGPAKAALDKVGDFVEMAVNGIISLFEAGINKIIDGFNLLPDKIGGALSAISGGKIKLDIGIGDVKLGRIDQVMEFVSGKKISDMAKENADDFRSLKKTVEESRAAIENTEQPVLDLGDGLSDLGTAAADATDQITAEQQALIDLASAVNASGLSWQEYAGRLNVVGAFMEDFNLSAEDMVSILQRSGLAADDFYNRLEALTILNDLKDDANAAADAVSGLYDSMSKIFEKPSQEESQQRFALAQLKEQRARLIAGGAKPDSRKVKALDEEIDQIEAEIAVRRAHRETLEAEAAAGDKSALADIDQEKAARMVIGAMGPLSTTAADFNAKLFVATWGMSELTKWIVSLTGATSDAQRAMERYARSTPGEREALANATPEELERLWAGGKAPSFQHGGMMPYTGMAHLEKGETVLKAGQRSSQTFYGPVTVMAPAGSGNSLADLERWLR